MSDTIQALIDDLAASPEPTADELAAILDAPPVPREDLCRLDAWCLAAHGHAGVCISVPRRPMPPTDFGPRAATSTRRGG